MDIISSPDFCGDLDFSDADRILKILIFVAGLSPKYLSAPFLASLLTCTGSYLF